MTDFEKSLTKAMQRVDAPEALIESVMMQANAEQISAPRKPKWSWSISRPLFGVMAFAAASLLLVGVVGGERVHERHVREEEATQQFETATRITDQALEHAREQLARAGVSLEQ
jgi:hypothetical protein